MVQTFLNTQFHTHDPQALGYTLWFSLFSLKLNIFPFSASILTFSTQNYLILKYFTDFDTTHFSTIISKFVKYFKIKWFCVEKVKIEALKGKIFNVNEKNENNKVYPSVCVLAFQTKGYKNPRFIMTYTRWWSWHIWLFYYTLLFTKPKHHVIEIMYGRGKFVGDFNNGTL